MVQALQHKLCIPTLKLLFSDDSSIDQMNPSFIAARGWDGRGIGDNMADDNMADKYGGRVVKSRDMSPEKK